MTRHRLFWPTLVLIGLLLGNLAFTPDFFSIQIRDGHLYGSLVDILRLGAPLILVGLGMTLVIATGGIDLSVGSVVAISGAMSCLMISKLGDMNDVAGVLTAIAVGVLLAAALGIWNGFLVAGLGIQPIVATLILMVAGRGLAQLITDGQIITVRSSPYKLIGAGYWLAVPFSILVALGVFRPGQPAGPAVRAGHADRGGRWQRGGEPAGRGAVAAAGLAGLRVLCHHGRDRRPDDLFQRVQRRREQRRAVHRT